jgi:hypothetical protein
MRHRISKAALICIAFFLIGFGAFTYWRFHDPTAWISRSPTHPNWAVDLVGTGFVDVGQDFRVHDLRASLTKPYHVCDLYWEDRHWPRDLYWSRDGSVAAITVGFHGHPGVLFACAYDFREHQALRSGSFGSPLEPSLEVSDLIKKLLEERGGVGDAIRVPDVTKMGIQ